MSLDFDLNIPVSPSGHNGSVDTDNSGFPPFIIDVSDSEEEDSYSPPPAKSTFTSQDTVLPAHGGGFENAIKGSFESNAQSPRSGEVEYLFKLLGLGKYVAAGDGDVLSGSIDVAGFEKHIYSPKPAENTFTSRDTPVAEQVEFDEVTDVIMMDAGDVPTVITTNINDILGSVLQGKVISATGNKNKQVTVILDSDQDFPMAFW
ncbi:hypothetical protein F4801DRAFT_566610 [Xylaria longipes]|nr:hypothetical protein F4801DRAFT_566610 [Xylaria longipes]RYC53717.1 hypothetical protein CHU98_g12492 [Xylaria longipes]